MFWYRSRMVRGARWKATACGCAWLACAAVANANTNDALLIVYPQAWEDAVTNFATFKTRLGFSVTNRSVESIVGVALPTNSVLRDFLYHFRTNTAYDAEEVYVLFVGDFDAIPAPPFLVRPGDGAPYNSDLYYSDLHTDFDPDTDGILGEYDSGGGEDFDAAGMDAVFAGISNDVIVGRVPAWPGATVDEVRTFLDGSVAFEREVSARKDQAMMTAGRIIVTNNILFYSDSWDYVLKGVVNTISNDYPVKTTTTVVHMDSNYTDRAGIDYAVEGTNIAADYTVGQDIVRGLWETNDNCSFLCNVSHGGSDYDFSLRRNGKGLPEGVRSAIAISMSCASYPLGRTAFTNGLAVAYLGSVAVVTPDAQNVLLGGMVSGEVQEMGAIRIFCQTNSVGETFKEGFQYYVDNIPSRGLGNFYGANRPAVLRNVIGFQIIGDPSLVHAYPDGDLDGLLDAEELTIGTTATTNDTDGDGLPDGLEFFRDGVDPLIHDGVDVDDDGSPNADELVAGTDPLEGTNFLAFFSVTWESGQVVLEWNSVTGRVYSLTGKTNLLDLVWQDRDEQTNIPGTGARVVRTNAAGGAVQVFGLDVGLAP